MAHRNNYGNYDSRANRIAGGILIVIISLLACLSLFNAIGGVGKMISGFLIGVFGYVSYAYAICGVFLGIMITIGRRVTLPANKIVKYFSMFAIAVLIFHVWFSRNYFFNNTYGGYLKALYGGESAAGLLGGIVAWLFMKVFTPAYAMVALIILFAIVSILSFYPVLVNKLPYRTKSTKIKANKKGASPVLTDIGYEGREEKVTEQSVGNKLFVGTLNENGADKSKKPRKNTFSLLFPNQDTAGVTEDSVKEPVFETEDAKRKRAKEKLYGTRKEDDKRQDTGVSFGTSVNQSDEIKPSLSGAGFAFSRNDAARDDGVRRPQTLREAFDLPESDEEKARDIQERFGYILDTPTTANDIRGAASKRIAEPKRKKPVEQPAPEPENKKDDNGIPEDMPYFIRDILYGDKDKKQTSDNVKTDDAKKDEENIKSSYRPVDDAVKPSPEPEIMKPLGRADEKPAEPAVRQEEKSESTGSIFTLFGAGLPDKKSSGTVKPVNAYKPENDVKNAESVKPDTSSKPEVYERPAPEKPRANDTVLPVLNGDGYNSGYPSDNAPVEKPMTRLEEMQAENSPAKSDASMPTEAEMRDAFSRPERTVPEKPRQPYAPREQSAKKDNSYTNDFPVGKNAKPVSVQPEKKKSEQISIDQAILAEQQKKPYMAPPVDLLKRANGNIVAEDFSEKIVKLENVFNDFKIPAKVIGVTQGPTFSRFELQMPTGISVSAVTKYADDIAMKLQVKGAIRFETPIPGKDAFGIEIANDVRTPVVLRSVLEGEKFNTSKSEMTFALGKDIANDDVVCDLDSMPHMLIAGGTGSGKSVCINSLIISLLYRNGPNDLKLILIDPKMVEMTPYNGLPHLLVPEAIDDVAAAVNSLDWAISEMQRRYKLFKGICRNITEYNEYASKHEGVTKLPRIVIIFDELADFMAKMKRQIEDKINALARLARAAGIHLIISTQRPSVDVITGTIKSNLPSRIALSLKTAADSTTILGSAGAEKLLGYGDMLYYPTSFNEPQRLQGCYVSSEEVFAVVDYIKSHNESYYDPDAQNVIFRQPEEEKDEEEVNPQVAYAHAAVGRNGETQQFIDALFMCVKEQKASISRIQRKFGVGYGTAANIVDLMEEKHFVSPNKGGNSQRDVLITMEQFNELYGARPDTTEFDLPEDNK